jgi:hypothetical protein
MTDFERVKKLNKIILDRLSSLNTLSGGSTTEISWVRNPEKCLNAFVEKYTIGNTSFEQYKGVGKEIFKEQYPNYFKKCLTFSPITLGYFDGNDPSNCVIPKTDCQTPQIGGNSDKMVVLNSDLLKGTFETILAESRSKGINLDSGDEATLRKMIDDYSKLTSKKVALERYIDVIQEIRREFGDTELELTSLNSANLKKISEEYNQIYKSEAEKVLLIIKVLAKLLEIK